jgi:hypothetical protein
MKACKVKGTARTGNDTVHIDIHEECKKRCRTSIILSCIERHPGSLSMVDDEGCLPLHRYLCNKLSTVEVASLMMETYPKALRHQNRNDQLPLHVECKYLCRSSIISKCIYLYRATGTMDLEALAVRDCGNDYPLHSLLKNKSSSVDDALMMIEKYPEILRRYNRDGDLPLHIECKNQCRSSVLSKCIKLYPDGLEGGDSLHMLLRNESSSIDDALLMIKKCPAALKRRNREGRLPIHIECEFQCRLSVLLKCIQEYRGSLNIGDNNGYVPLDVLLKNQSSSTDAALMMIEEFPKAVTYWVDDEKDQPLLMECRNLCRSAVILKCIEYYPDGLTFADEWGNFPLHRLLGNKLSPIDAALKMIEEYPRALRYENNYRCLPLHVECNNQCRALIISKCIELYPASLDDKVFFTIMSNVDKDNFHSYSPALSVVAARRPMSMYNRDLYSDISEYPYYRRKTLSLLPHETLNRILDADFRNLNWQPRAAMMMLLSRIRQLNRRSKETLVERLRSMIVQAQKSRRYVHWQRCLLLRIIMTSTVTSPVVDEVDRGALCQQLDSDIGDILLRSIFAYL